MDFHKAAVIGTGMMGPGIAASLALGGVASTIVSRSDSGARQGHEAAARALRLLAEAGLADARLVQEALSRLAAGADLEAAAAGADLVIESIPESMPLKQALWARLEAVVRPETVLASNTSGLSITEMASRCAHPERVVTTHFWNPPHLMPLVEIVRGRRTAQAVVDALQDLLQRCGKVPVVVLKDRPGQLGNRLQMALVREAINIVAEGIAAAEDVDRAAKLGFGLRLPVYGILEHQDIVGLELGYAVCDYVCRDLNNEPRAPKLYQEKIARGETGAASGHGFHDWTKKSAGEVKERRDRWLIECLRSGVAKDA